MGDQIALLGYFDAADEARLSALAAQLDSHRQESRFVDYDDAEDLAFKLAASLTETLGPEVLKAARVEAIPRGGLVVLGMLGYALEAHPDRTASDSETLRVVVDDCAISGARFLRWLDDHPGPPVVFAHLYSHPELRRSLKQDPRVVDCVAADDLVDHAPSRLGERYDAWVAGWQGRDSGVWAGQVGHLAFAWNEPDVAIWNSVTEELEPGWRLVGPRLCLKNRRQIPEDAIQQTSRSEGELTPGPGVLWADFDEQVVVADTVSGDVLGLAGVGAVMWLEAVGSSTEEEALERLGGVFSVDRSQLRSDWDEFVGRLTARGLLVRS
jgi:hypothetical protein